MRESFRVHGEEVGLLTVTAPGDDVLPRDSWGVCLLPELETWAATMMSRWNDLNHLCQMRARRAFKYRGLIVLASVWQLQPGRLAPHVHVVFPDNPGANFYAHCMKAMGPSYGFGTQIDIKVGEVAAAGVGHYLASYMAGEKEYHAPVEYLRLLPRRRCYVSRALSVRCGATMRVAKKLRHLWYYANKDRSIGLPSFKDEIEEAWTYYWYKVGRHGIDNVKLPVLVSGA